METLCSGLNRLFDKIYVINLEKRPDRLLKVLWQLDGIDTTVEVVAAVDGQSPELLAEYQRLKGDPRYFKTQLAEGKRLLNSGEYAYLKTWAQIIRAAQRAQYEWILCLDDDVILPVNWHERFAQSKLSELREQSESKLIWLGASQHQHQLIDWDLAAEKGYYHPQRTDGSFAVAVNRAVYSKLLGLIERFDRPLDSGPLTTLARSLQTQTAVLYPNLIIADLTESDIRASRSQEEMAKKFHWGETFQCHYQYPVELPWVSVIVPVYNAETTIEISLASLVRQTYTYLEIIVIDDASTDESWDRIRAFHEQLSECYPRFSGRLKIFQNPEQKGCYASRNVGFSYSTGQLIAFQDADDISLLYRIEQQLVYLFKYQVLWTQCLVLRTHQSQLSLEPEELEEQIRTSRVHFLKKYAKHANNANTTTNNTKNQNKTPTVGIYEYCCSGILGMVTGIYRRQVFDELGPFLELPCWADAEFCERLLAHHIGLYFSDKDDDDRKNNEDNDTDTYNVICYLRKKGHLPGLFYKVNQIMYLSHQMTQKNITHQYSLNQKLHYQEQWRQSLRKNDRSLDNRIN